MADSSIPITGGAGYNVDTHTTTNGDHRQVVAVGDASSDNAAKVGSGGDQSVSLTNPSTALLGFNARITPFGELAVAGTPTTILQDVFEGSSIDTTALWSTSGTITPTQSGGNLQLSPGTANSASSIVVSQASFAPQGMGFTMAGWLLNLESAQQTNPNLHRYFGLGQVTSYTAATPVTDGAGFEIALDGALQCVVYVGGTKYVINSTTAANISSSVAGAGGSGTPVPSQAMATNFGQLLTWSAVLGGAVFFRPEAVFWFIGDQNVPVAFCRYLAPNVSTLPMRMAAITKPAVATVLSSTFNFSSVFVGDSGQGNTTLSDATYPWRKAAIGKAGGMSVQGAQITPVTTAIGATLTGTTGSVDVAEAGTVTFVVRSTTPAVPYTGAPVIVFEQSDDATSWAPLSVVSGDTGYQATTFTLPAGIANSSLTFDAAVPGVNWVRARLTTGTTANGLSISVRPSGMALAARTAVIPPSDQRLLVQALSIAPGNVVSLALTGQSQVTIQITGTWTSILAFEATLDGTTFVPLSATQVGSTNTATTTTTINGAWHVSVAGFTLMRVRCTIAGTGAANVSLSASAAAPGDPVGLFRPDSVARVATDPTSLYSDTFETLNTTDAWTAAGSISPTVASGQLSCSAGLGALQTSYLRSQPVFPLAASAYLQVSMLVQVEAAVLTGNKAWWGLGVPAGSPSVALPLTNGVVFEILDTDGALYGAVYSAGSRISSVALARPTDAAQHTYAIYYQSARVFWEIDGITVASLASPNIAVGALPLSIGSVNGGGALGTARTLNASAVSISDTGSNTTQLADATYGWRKASIGKSGGLAVRGASIAGVTTQIAPSATGTIGPLDVSEAGNVTFIVKNTVSTLAWGGAPVLVFEQSDDNISWSPLPVVRSDLNTVASTFTLPAGVNNVELLFTAAMPGVNWVRVRVTTGPITNSLAVVIQPGGMPITPLLTIAAPSRAPVIYYSNAPVASTATETLQSLSGTKAGASVGGTTTPAVVTAGKTFRVQRMSCSYIATATTGYLMVRLRANTAGVVALGSPAYKTIAVGAGTPATANSTGMVEVSFGGDGLEFPAGTGVGITVTGMAGAAAAAVGFAVCELSGYEY